MTAIQKLLIANRGEIASRVMRTCRRLGIETVAVYSDADADAPFVREADEAVRLGPAPSAQSYLAMDKVIEAAKRTGADAIHPGFGFLAENAGFARAITEAGLVFVGPTPEAIESMGSKQRAKQIARDAGVPVIEGYDGEAQDEATFVEQAERIGYPVLLKASAGGGGKGMRICRSKDEVGDALASAKREAASSFGDDTMLVEKYLERPRHIELQIIGDSHGEVIHLMERECSIQRRHQKIVEEAPSVALTPELREKMGEAAVSLAKAIGYTNAGTVEMILDAAGDFYFLEVNTRLQVEHPVTEEIFDLDLVELQLKVARGDPLGLAQDDVQMIAHGHAIEVRVYAEDPDAGFLPQTGRLVEWSVPEAEGVRVDSGVETGTEVSVHYDPMLAKIITWGLTREDAIARLRWTLRRTVVAGVTTNRDFLVRVLDHPAFRAGELHTHFVEEHLAEPDPPSDALVERAAIGATLAAWAERVMEREVLPAMTTGFRNNPFSMQRAAYTWGERELVVEYADRGAGALEVRVGDASHTVCFGELEDGAVAFVLDDHRVRVGVRTHEGRHYCTVDGRAVVLDDVPRFPVSTGESASDGAFAPMPGAIIAVKVAAGDTVTTGQTLVVMEAMKMEHAIGAPHDGVVAEMRVEVGAQVDEGAVLVIIKDADEGEGD